MGIKRLSLSSFASEKNVWTKVGPSGSPTPVPDNRGGERIKILSVVTAKILCPSQIPGALPRCFPPFHEAKCCIQHSSIPGCCPGLPCSLLHPLGEIRNSFPLCSSACRGCGCLSGHEEGPGFAASSCSPEAESPWNILLSRVGPMEQTPTDRPLFPPFPAGNSTHL